MSGRTEVEGSSSCNTIPLWIRCKCCTRPTNFVGCLIFDGKFRIHLNEKLLLVSLSDKSEGSDLTLNMESHDNMLERLQSCKEVWDGRVEFSGCRLCNTILVLFSMAFHANLALPPWVCVIFICFYTECGIRSSLGYCSKIQEGTAWSCSGYNLLASCSFKYNWLRHVRDYWEKNFKKH